MIDQNRQSYAVQHLYRGLGVSRSSYQARRDRDRTLSEKGQQLLEQIKMTADCHRMSQRCSTGKLK